MDPTTEDEGRDCVVRVPYEVVKTVHGFIVQMLSGAEAVQKRDLVRFQRALEDATVEPRWLW